MDRDHDLDTLTALLLDPCLTVNEAQREAAATPRRAADERRPDRHRPREHRGREEYLDSRA